MSKESRQNEDETLGNFVEPMKPLEEHLFQADHVLDEEERESDLQTLHTKIHDEWQANPNVMPHDDEDYHFHDGDEIVWPNPMLR